MSKCRQPFHVQPVCRISAPIATLCEYFATTSQQHMSQQIDRWHLVGPLNNYLRSFWKPQENVMRHDTLWLGQVV